MGLFSGLESLGLGKMKNTEVFEKEEKKETAETKDAVKPQKQESDALFDKTYTCPICGKPVATEYTRVVGFYTPVKTWTKARRKEYTMRRWERVNG